MKGFSIRVMRPEDRWEVAELICMSTNYWYQVHGFPMIFPSGPQSTVFHFDTYHTLEGSSGIVAADVESGRIIGSCFQHVRPTHVSLGIMNVHPNHARRGVAGALLREIVEKAQAAGRPVRLVSSAMNLDSYSLYNRAGFLTFAVYQDMTVRVPADGFRETFAAAARVRPATLSDLDAITDLEREVTFIERPGDYRHFIRNADGNWHVSVCEDAQEAGRLEGVLVSCLHAACNMIGPGAMRTSDATLALLQAELNVNVGRAPVFLVPVTAHAVIRQAYAWGARNCELHFAQALDGFHTRVDGIAMPTFMPESN
jgi:GNAT superfamily N-acetyltransferase